MYTDVFGSNTLPPSEYGYNSLTITVDTTLVWPYNSDNTNNTLAKIVQVSCQSGNAVTLPDARQVSVGEDFLFRNTGANALIVKDASGAQIASVDSGAASYFYLTDNTTLAGMFGVIGFGVGTSTVDAASLVGYGIKAVGASLNQSHPVVPYSSGTTVDADHRSKLIVFTGGTSTFNLTSAGTLGDDYFTMFRNEGTGTATIDPASSETIDGVASLQVQPGESLILVCTGTQWYSVGYGRSTLYQFTQLTKDVSAGGTITLSASEASNKLITFIGNPASAVNVIVPSIVAVYYTQSAISTAQTVTLKTAAGSGVGITQGARIIALCDGTNVVSAQSAVANASVSLTDGSAAVPSLFFATQTNTGLFKSGSQDVGLTVNGSAVGVFGSTGLQTSTIGPNSTQRHTLPAVSSDTVTLNTATQTLTNKTLVVSSNTVTTAASGNLAATELNAALAELQGDIDTRATASALTSHTSSSIAHGTLSTVVGISDTQTLTNKTVNLSSNTLTGTLAQFNSALSDADFASLAGTETLTNKTIGSGSTWSGNTLTVANGGTGATTLTGLVKGNGTSAFTAAVPGTDYTVPANTVPRDSATGAASIPTGTTAQRPGSPSYGDTRINSTLNQPEWWNGATWVQVADTGSAVTLTGTQTLQNKTLDSTNNISGASGHLAGFRNIIINGGFAVNQRAYVSGAAVGSGLYGHDRWKMAASADTYTFSTTANKTTVTIPAGKVLRQVIEGLNLQTGTYTLSWEGTAQGKIGAGSYGASGITGSITGGANTTIEFGPGTVANVQLELGSITTPFEHRPYGLELSLCQRYYEVGALQNACVCYSSNLWMVPRIGFCITKRAVPTVTVSRTAGITTGSSGPQVSVEGFRDVISTTGTANTNSFVDGTWTAAIEL